jgi:MFS family permease
VAALLTGLGGALFAPAVRAYLASESGERRVEAFALFQICEGMGACLGPVLGAVLFQISFQLVCVMASVLFLVLTILQLFYLPPREAPETSAPRPVRSEWKEVLANRAFVIFAVGMVAYLTLYSQLYLSLPLEIRRLTGDDAGTGILFTICALLSIMTQVHITACLKAHCRPLQAIAVGLTLMGGAFLPLLAARPFLPIHTLPGAFGDTTTLHAVLMGAINFSPVFVSAMLLSVGTMVVSPFALSLIPVLGGNRLLGTYFGFYYLVQGSGTVVGNLAIGAAFDAGKTLGFQSFPWLLLVGFGLASAASIMALDCKGMKAHTAGVSRLATMTAARS